LAANKSIRFSVSDSRKIQGGPFVTRVHFSLPIIILPLTNTHLLLCDSPDQVVHCPHLSVGSLVSSRHFPGHRVRTLFHQRVCGAIKRGASEANHFPRAFSWLLSASEWRTYVSSVNWSCQRDFKKENCPSCVIIPEIKE